MTELWIATFVSGDDYTWREEELTALAGVTSPFGAASNREDAKKLVAEHVTRRSKEDLKIVKIYDPIVLGDWNDEEFFSTANSFYTEDNSEPEGFYGVIRIII